MKRPITLIPLIFLGFVAFGLSSCATDGGSGGTGTYAEPDPLMQQAQMQEDMSKITRSLIR